MSRWHRFLVRLIRRLYYNRVTVLHADRMPASGPVLYLGLHRNGAVDGFVYASVLPRATFMISTQLRKSLLGKLFFAGIEVVRGKDEGNREANAQALTRCRDLLKSGGELFILPEGTSTLGPRHLPFKSGAARVLRDALDHGVPVAAIPLGIHYESAWSFRSNVEIVVGPPVPLGGDRSEMNRRLEAALEDVGVNVATAADQERIEMLACVSTLATNRSYYRTLKALEKTTPGGVAEEWEALRVEIGKRVVFTHQRVPLIPLNLPWLHVLFLIVLGPIVLVAGLANLVPLAGGCIAGRVFPDDTNVIALWRILVGLPLFIVWILAIAILIAVIGAPWAFAAYLAVTILGLGLYHRVRKLAVAVGNFLLHPGLRPSFLAFRENLLKALPNEPA